MNTNRRRLRAALEFYLAKLRLMSILYRRIKQNIADKESSLVSIDRPPWGEKSNERSESWLK